MIIFLVNVPNYFNKPVMSLSVRIAMMRNVQASIPWLGGSVPSQLKTTAAKPTNHSLSVRPISLIA